MSRTDTTQRIGTANIRVTLDDFEARLVLRKVLNQGAPGLLGCLEWDAPVPRDLPPGYKADRCKHGKLIVWDARRYQLMDLTTRLLVRGEFVGHLPGRRSRLGANHATLATFYDRATRKKVILVVAHLTAEVQIDGHYRRDLAHRTRVRRHKREMAALRVLAKDVDWIVGDLNWDGETHLGPLVACWVGHKRLEADGTLGGRSVDYCFARERADDVLVIPTASDHDALSCTYH